MKIERKTAAPLESVLQAYIKAMHLTASHNTHRIFEAWGEASGAESLTLKKFFKDGTLYVTLSSSVARSQLQMQLLWIKQKMNELLVLDPLFIKGGDDSQFVKEIILK